MRSIFLLRLAVGFRPGDCLSMAVGTVTVWRGKTVINSALDAVTVISAFDLFVLRCVATVQK